MLGVETPVSLRCSYREPVQIRVTHGYRVVDTRRPGDDRYKVSSTRYYYTVERDQSELLSFQWHPKDAGERVYPHIHLRAELHAAGGLTDVYIPTGRVPLERFLWMLLQDFHVEPNAKDWKKTLYNTLKGFESRSTWGR